MSELSEREVDLFATARRLPAGERPTFLDGVCAGNPAMRQRLGEMLAVDETAGDFLERPARSEINARGSPAPPAGLPGSAPEKPGDRIGPYKLLQQIGEGGCGVVFMAEQEAPIHRRVALKVIKLGMDTKLVVA